MGWAFAARALNRIAALTLGVLLMLTLSPPKGAPAHASGDTLTLQITNGSSFIYGQQCINFTAVLTLATPPTANVGYPMNIYLSNGQVIGTDATSESADHMTHYFTLCTKVDGTNHPILVGNNITTYGTAYTQQNPTGVTSNTVTFSVVKATTTTSCDYSYTFSSPGAALMLRAIYSPGTVTQGDQFTVTFTGPVTVTTPALTVDSSGAIHATLPSTYGIYRVACTFLGNGQYLGSTSTGIQQVTVSQMQKLGGIRLYTNPTTFNPNLSTQMYLVFQAASGGPTPTGYFSINVGGASTKAFPINSDGTALVTLYPLHYAPSPATIVVWIQGDPYYNAQSQTFSLTNPPIPGSAGGSGGGSTKGVSATKTPGAATTPTPAASATVDGVLPGSTATSGQPGDNIVHPGAKTTGPSWVFWLGGITVLLLAAGTGVIVYVLRRRRLAPEPEHMVGQEPPLFA